MKIVKLTAEIGCNHQGDLALAKEMIRRAAMAGADIVKFQKRCLDECLTPEQAAAPHPDPRNSFGATYREHRAYLEFSVEEHQELSRVCQEHRVEYGVSVWDLTSARQMMPFAQHLKIPSALNQNEELLELVAPFDGLLHCSTGMTDASAREKLIENESIDVLYLCTSAYPCAPKDTYLGELLSGSYNGFSGHHEGTDLDLAAACFVSYIERHFTLSKTFKGTDQPLSLEPHELARLRRRLDVQSAAFRKKPQEVPECEWDALKKLKKDPK